MDWMTFITKITDSVAWPAAIALVIWWLKSHIGQLIPFTKKFKYGELEIEFEFEQQLKELKKEAEASKLEHATHERDNSEMLEYISVTADVSPRAAIVDAWVGLELTAFSSACLLGNYKRHMPFSRLIQALESEGIIKSKDALILKKLQRLRNEALHSPDFKITKKEAQEFAELTRDMADLIAGECFQKSGGCGH